MTIKEQMDQLQRDIMEHRHAIAQLKEQYDRLYADRVHGCQHVWGEALKGYEHEGVTCTLCGINDMMIPR